MSRYFPHTAYAEDQPLACTILTTHVLTRGVTTGAVIGTGIFALRPVVSRMRGQQQPPAPAPAPPSSSAAPGAAHRLLHATGRSTLITLGVVSLGLAGRMWGREDIEWRDRAWRLRASRGQTETDDWTYAGMLLGGGAAAAAVRPLGALALVGAVSLGSLAGTLGYLGWRYGVNGGRFPGEEGKGETGVARS